MCTHLILLEQALRDAGIKETFRGKPWSKNCREWVYYDCVFDLPQLQHRFNFDPYVKWHTNEDNRSGMEAGFICESCNDAVIGIHPHFGSGKIIFA